MQRRTDSLRHIFAWLLALAVAGPTACSEPSSPSNDTGPTGGDTKPAPGDGHAGDTASSDDGNDASADATLDSTADTADATGGDLPEGVDAQLLHQFPAYSLQPGEEVVPCVQWSLDNDKPLYVNSVTLANGGGFHHSNWFVVPESYAPGGDGFFDCDDRGFSELTAALRGTVLFAQSTQAQSEVQKLPPGVTIKIPPNYKVVADVHFLNIATRKLETNARMTLGLTHPKNVDTVVSPFRLQYHDLDIPPKSEARFSGECNFADPYSQITGGDLDMKVYYVLPHYHGLGNYFQLEMMGGPRDGEEIFELKGFNAEANGQTLTPPVDMSGAKGFRFTCGYDNPRDESVKWGLGNQEMCVMLGFAEAGALVDADVKEGNHVTDRKDGIVYNEGPCEVQALPKSDDQGPPSKEEKNAEMYVPEGDSQEDLDPIPDCEERPGTAEPFRKPTLTNLQNHLFSVGCAFSSCHNGDSPAAGLNLNADDLHAELTNHQVLTPTDMPLVDPGNPQGSWLYEVTSKCEPTSDVGTVSHMPRNSPTLLEPEMLAMIREWIARGAKDN